MVELPTWQHRIPLQPNPMPLETTTTDACSFAAICISHPPMIDNEGMAIVGKIGEMQGFHCLAMLQNWPSLPV